MLSLLSVGGAISTTSEMPRYLVDRHHWLNQEQFNNSIALAQAAPGPNVLFVALMGWHVGMNTGSMGAALLGVAVTMCGIMMPSTLLTYTAAQWGQRNRELRAVRAFKLGMALVIIGLLLSTGSILGTANGKTATDWPLWLLTVAAGLILWRTRIHILYLLAFGGLAGWFQWV